MKHISGQSAAIIAATCMCFGSSVLAEGGGDNDTDVASSGKGQLEEIIVSAQRRDERLEAVPISVNVVSAAQVQDMGITGALGLTAAVPNLNVMMSGASNFNPFIRGVGAVSGDPNDEASVATYVDGVYIAAPTGVIALPLNNIDHIEVLKGPQGTLFGRDATAGVIQIITKEPSETTGGNVDVSYAEYQTATVNAYGTTGLADGVAADLALYYSDQGEGYGRDLPAGDKNTFAGFDMAVRSKLLIKPGDTTTIHVAFDASREFKRFDYQLAPGAIGVDGVTTYPGPYNFVGNFPMSNESQQGGVSARLDQELGPIRIVDIASFRRTTNVQYVDEDATPLNVVSATVHGTQKDYSEELQILPRTSGRINWLVGLFYFDNKAGDDPANVAGLAAAPLPYVDYVGIQHTKSLSGFGQVTAEIIPGTKLTVGARDTTETQNIHGAIQSTIGTVVDGGFQQTTFNRPTWRIALDQDLTDGVHAYVSDNLGVKSGGFDVFAPGTAGYSPETLDAYEVGIKSELFSRRLFLNAAAFYYNYTNIQVSQAGEGFVFTRNAAAARIYGLDLDFQTALTDQWRLSGGLGLLNGKFIRFPGAVTYGQSAGPEILFNAAGKDTPLTSPASANLSSEYRFPTPIGDFRVGGAVSYNDGSYMDAGNRLRYPGYTLLSSYVGWTDAKTHVGLRLWVNNLTDATYYIQRYASALGDLQMQAPPRTIGGTVSMKF